MTSEVQRIIAVSLNKIVSSRSRRGGISLHRNLLVASVLLRAKDAYIAETVAKRKLDMNNQVVISQQDDDESGLLSNTVEDMDTDIPCACDESLDDSSSDEIESERHRVIEEEEDLIEHSNDDMLRIESSDNQAKKNVRRDEDSCLSEDLSSEQFKENIDPDDFCTDMSEMKSVSVVKRCSRKRQISELEQAVVSIGGQLNSPDCGRCTCGSVCSCSSDDSCSPQVKRGRLDNVDTSSEQLDSHASSSITVSKSRDGSCLTNSHSVNNIQKGYVCISSDISQSLSEQAQKLSGYRSVQDFCPVEAKSGIFTTQVSLACPSILVATI
jgi:hypothetical protein